MFYVETLFESKRMAEGRTQWEGFMESKGEARLEFDEEDITEVYADAVNLETGFYGSTLTFGVFRRDRNPRGLARVRLSPQMMKVLCLLLRQQGMAYERDMAHIQIPETLKQSIGLEITEVY